MGKLVEAAVRMGPHDWHRTATEAVTLAVTVLHDEAGMHGVTGRVNALTAAGNLLSAAMHMRGHANMLEIEGGDDVATVDVWDLSDEGMESTPAWPVMSARLREVAGDDPRLVKIIGHIDRLHALAIEKGLPVATLAELEAEAATTG